MPHKLAELIHDNTVIFDGGLGSMLIAAGLPAGKGPEAWNLERPDAVAEVHRQYFAAGVARRALQLLRRKPGQACRARPIGPCS